jgi:hypothetical protein
MAGRLDLSPGAAVVLDGAEWRVEQAEPHHARVVLVGTAGERMTVSFRFLINHPNCRPSARPSAVSASSRGRQPAWLSDLSHQQQEWVALRLAHLLEVETGFRGGDPHRPGPGEPKPCYDPAVTTVTQRRRAKVAELAALDPEHAQVIGLGRVAYRTLVR